MRILSFWTSPRIYSGRPLPLSLGPEGQVKLLRKRTAHTLSITPTLYAHPPDRVPLEIVFTRRYLSRIGREGTNVNTTPQPAPPSRGSHESIASQYGRRTVNKAQVGFQVYQQCCFKTKGTDASPLKNRFVSIYFHWLPVAYRLVWPTYTGPVTSFDFNHLCRQFIHVFPRPSGSPIHSSIKNLNC